MTIVCVDNTPIMLQSLKENAESDLKTITPLLSGFINRKTRRQESSPTAQAYRTTLYSLSTGKIVSLSLQRTY